VEKSGATQKVVGGSGDAGILRTLGALTKILRTILKYNLKSC